SHEVRSEAPSGLQWSRHQPCLGTAVAWLGKTLVSLARTDVNKWVMTFGSSLVEVLAASLLEWSRGSNLVQAELSVSLVSLKILIVTSPRIWLRAAADYKPKGS
ncbi:hypothetical protein HPP92_028932, partial [Vanilla planifolia]